MPSSHTIPPRNPRSLASHVRGLTQLTDWLRDPPAQDFSFATIRLAGHMVPTFQPAPALAFFERFLGAKPM